MSEIADIMRRDRCSWREAKAKAEAALPPVRSEPLLACAAKASADPKTYTLKQLRQAWGAGKCQAYETFEQFIQDEIENGVENQIEEVMVRRCSECQSQMQTEASHLQQALSVLIDDVEGEGIRVRDWVRRLAK